MSNTKGGGGGGEGNPTTPSRSGPALALLLEL